MAVPVISVAQMRQWEEATWAAGITEASVIEKVGKGVARRALKMTQAGERIICLAGKGHNGDDARAAAEHLPDRLVTMLTVESPERTLAELEPLLREPGGILIDGLFGIGLNRPLEGPWVNLVSTVNGCGWPILAIDVPSGLNAETGDVSSGTINASVTLTVGAPKRGLIHPSSIYSVGRLEVLHETGLVPCPFTGKLQWTAPDDFVNFPPVRRVDGHKGVYGHAVIFAGSMGYHGAAVLSARGALRARPGLVTVFTQENVYHPVASQLQAAMVHRWGSNSVPPETCTALLFGPGLASPDLSLEFKQQMNKLWHEFPRPVIVDATGLSWLEPGPTPLNSRRVITPHPGEAARLLESTVDLVQTNRVAALRELSSRYGNCWVVLKGHQTLVGRSNGEVYINPTGNPDLAQGGSGDILAGYLAGLLAQSKLQAEPLKTIRFGVWQHGAAADRLTGLRIDWTIEELVQTLGQATRRKLCEF